MMSSLLWELILSNSTWTAWTDRLTARGNIYWFDAFCALRSGDVWCWAAVINHNFIFFFRKLLYGIFSHLRTLHSLTGVSVHELRSRVLTISLHQCCSLSAFMAVIGTHIQLTKLHSRSMSTAFRIEIRSTLIYSEPCRHETTKTQLPWPIVQLKHVLQTLWLQSHMNSVHVLQKVQ